MDPIIWAILLMALGLGLAALEIFIPSGGILGFLSIASIIGSVWLAFSFSSTAAGFVFIGTAAVGLPVVILFAFKWLPHTPVGKRLLLGTPKSDDVLPEEDPRKKYRELIGKHGIAKSAMLPGGAIEIDGKTCEAVSESGAIDQGDAVEVVRIRNNRMVVKRLDLTAPNEDSAITGTEDPLSQPIDSLGIDPFEDPLS